MPAELFVDLRYKGMDLGRGLRLEDMTPSSAYLQHPTPMPVGSKLIMDADTLEVSVCVTAVREQVAGAERPPGMFVEPEALDVSAQQWWDDKVSSDGTAELPPSDVQLTESPSSDAQLDQEPELADTQITESSSSDGQLDQEPEPADTQITEVSVPAAEVATEQAAVQDTVEMPVAELFAEASKTPKSKSKKRRNRRKKSK